MTACADSLFIRALQRKPIPRTPIWLMRQAGRYLPEYRKTRAQAGDFLSLCKHTELACEVTLQPLRRYDLDAAILFSDILTIPDAMGLGLYFAEGEGPRFHQPVQTRRAIEQLIVPSMKDSLSYVMDAVRLIRRELPANLPLIGFSGSPWTLACYMVEGQGRSQFPLLQQLIENEPETAELLLGKLATAVTDYLCEQVNAGANVLMIFDTWGGILSTDNYLRYSLYYCDLIVKAIKQKHPETPLILFTKGGGSWLQAMAETGCDALGVDWKCDLAQAKKLVGDKVTLQGNLAPELLLTDPDTIRQHTQAILAAYGHGHGHVFNLGHGITPEVPPEHVKVLVDAVREFSPPYHERLS